MGINRTEFSMGRAQEVSTTTTKTIIRIFKARRPWTCIDALVFLQNAWLPISSRRVFMVWIKIRKIQTVMICRGKDRPKMVPLPCRTAGEHDHHGVSLPQDKAYKLISWTGLEPLLDKLYIFPDGRYTSFPNKGYMPVPE